MSSSTSKATVITVDKTINLFTPILMKNMNCCSQITQLRTRFKCPLDSFQKFFSLASVLRSFAIDHAHGRIFWGPFE